jgi:hypothetical protein
MVEAMSQPREIAKSVAVDVHKSLHINAINNRILVPRVQHFYVEAKWQPKQPHRRGQASACI